MRQLLLHCIDAITDAEVGEPRGGEAGVAARVDAREGREVDVGGGRVEVLFLRFLAGGACEAVVGSNARLKAGEQVLLPAGWRCELLEPKALDGIREECARLIGAGKKIIVQ